MKDPSVLHLFLKYRYYDAINRGEKTVEYRDDRVWRRRIVPWIGPYSKIVFHRGYTNVTMTFLVKDVIFKGETIELHLGKRLKEPTLINLLEFSSEYIIGKEPQIEETSPRYSKQIAIAQSIEIWPEEKCHCHSEIEEYYLALEGTLLIQAENDVWGIPPFNMLCVPAGVTHKVLAAGRYLLIKANVPSDVSRGS